MTELDQKQLGKTLWNIADQLRGAMNADDFRDYMLSFLFLRYLSDNYEAAAEKELGRDYPKIEGDDRRVPLAVWYANNPDDVADFEKQMRRKVHYVIKPDHLWASIANLARTQNGELLNTLQADSTKRGEESWRTATTLPVFARGEAFGLKLCQAAHTGRRKSGCDFFISPTPLMRQYSYMGKRRESRERAVQFLFQHELNPPENLELDLAQFWNSQRAAAIEDEKGSAKWGEKTELPPPTTEEAETRLFAEPLIRGVIEHRDAIDEHIKKHAHNWEFNRIAAVDRNVMRLAIFEMLYREDIPPVVSINEAVDIAKKFSTHDSGKFVNGILDKVRSGILRPARDSK